MAIDEIIRRIAGADRPYAPPASLELAEDDGAIKCGEALYLSGKGGKNLFYHGGMTFAPETLPLTDELSGWTAELAMAPALVLPCDFGDGTASIEGGRLECRKLGEKLYVLTAEGSVILLDTSRFLLYGFVGGKAAGGYIRNIEQDR